MFELILYVLFGFALSELNCSEMWPYAICVVCFIASHLIGYIRGRQDSRN